MPVSRVDLLAAAEDDCKDAFLGLIAKHNARDDVFDVGELLSTLSRQQLEDFWSSVNHKCASALLHLDEVADDGTCVSRLMLEAIVTAAACTLSCTDTDVCQSYFETIVTLHGVLLSLPDGMETLHDGISRVCESWWNSQLPGRDELVPQTLAYLLLRCLEPSPSGVQFKRLWKMHESVAVIDLCSEQSDAVKQLFQQAVKSTAFHRSPEGRKFLSHLFTLDVEMVSDLHAAVKSVIPLCAKTSLDWIGEVYFKAWRGSTGDVLESIEKNCIQDLMFAGIHAQRTGKPSPADVLHRLLSYFHKHKKQNGVDAMLLKLYEPILWRSLKVANSIVRANAVTLLIDAFPLQSDDTSPQVMDELLQRQFDAFKSLLEDPSHIVRSLLAFGLCKICAVCWEYIPAEVIKTLLTSLVQKHAWDSSNTDVRLSVVKGFTFMVDYHLCYPFLQTVLPKLCQLIHDKVERVRLAIVDLLLKVKSLHAIKFWTVVPVDHLLARLEVDSSVVARRLVQLLFNSYMPVDKPLEVQVTRAIQLVRTNRGAARKFYLHAYMYMNVVATIKFILSMLGYIAEVVVQNGAQENGTVEDDCNSVTDEECMDIEMEELMDSTHNMSRREANRTLTDVDVAADDVDTVSGLLEAVAILMMGIQTALQKPSAANAKRYLELRVAKFLPVLIRNFEDPKIVCPLYTVAGFLPSNIVPTVSCSVLSKLRSLASADSASADYASLLTTMCNWKRGNEVLELISDWLEPFLVLTSAPRQRRSARRSRRMVMFAETATPYPAQALLYLDHLMAYAPCRTVLLEHNLPALRAITDCLRNTTVHIEKRLQAGCALDEPMNDDVLTAAFERYLRLEVLLNNKTGSQNSAIAALECLLSWIETQLLPCLALTGSQHRRPRRLLTSNDCTLMSDPEADALSQSVFVSDVSRLNISTDTRHLVTILIKRTLVITSDMMLIGIMDSELVSRVGEFCQSLLQHDESVLTELMPLMYRMIEHSSADRCGNVAEDEGVGCCANQLPRLLDAVFNVLTKRPAADEMVSKVRQPLSDVIDLYCRSVSESLTSDAVDILPTVTAAIVTDVMHSVQQDCNFEACTSVQQLPKLASLLLSILLRKHNTASLLLSELTTMCQSSAVDAVAVFAACIHIISAVRSERFCDAAAVRKCLDALRRREDTLSLPTNESDDSPNVILVTNARNLLTSCCSQAGMTPQS